MQTGIVTSSPDPVTGTKSKTPTKELDKNAFLNLLVAQLRNQDPSSAQDPNQMVQQMTAFSSLEQMQTTNKLLEGIQAQNQGLFQTQATNLVGKRLRVASDTFDLKDAKATLGVDLAAGAQVSLVIRDAKGNLVATLDKGRMDAGSNFATWDGKDAKGNQLPDGAYSVEVVAKDANGQKVQAMSSVYARVDAVNFLNGAIYLQAAGRHYALSDIVEIAA